MAMQDCAAWCAEIFRKLVAPDAAGPDILTYEELMDQALWRLFGEPLAVAPFGVRPRPQQSPIITREALEREVPPPDSDDEYEMPRLGPVTPPPAAAPEDACDADDYVIL